MIRFIISAAAILAALSSFSQPKNVLINDVGDPNEPSICINPLNVNEVVAGTNLNFVYRSLDGGLTWKTERLRSMQGVWGDPVIAVDTNGHFYFFHLSNPPNGNWIDRIVCQKSEDVGDTWTDGTYMGLDGTKAQDKEWAVVDRKNNNIYVTWTQFDQYGSRIDTHYSNIMFSKSLDGGQTWSQALRINEVSGDCIDSSLTTEGAVPAVGPNGEIYVSWAGPAGIRFDRSEDQGATWLDNDILVDSMLAGWNYNIPGINRSNGMPVTVCDLSGGKNHGTIYINWSDQRNGSDDTDVWLSQSKDGGNTWSKPLRVNDDTTKTHQFLTWMTIDQSSGFLYFIWYDRRNFTNKETEVYMAVSYDGGQTFVNGVLSEKSFDPDRSQFFGDYTNISAANGQVRPIWATMVNRRTQVYTALYTEQFNSVDAGKTFNWSADSYPNPFKAEVVIRFQMPQSGKASLSLFDLQGKKLATVVKKKKFAQGLNEIEFKAAEYNLTPGTYVYELEAEGMVLRKKLIFSD